MPRQTSFCFRPLHAAAVCVVALFFAGMAAGADADGAAGQSVSFSRDIAPILRAKCVACHNAEKSKGGYRLHTFADLAKPGDSGDVPVVSGKPARSKLHQVLITADADERMPQKDDPLPPVQIALMARWIEQGARFDGADPKAGLDSLVARVPHREPPAVYPRPVPVLALAFTPDGRELVASGYHEVTFWNPADGRLTRRVPQLPQQIQAITFSPASNVLAVCGGTPGVSGEVTLVDSQDPKRHRVLATGGDFFLCLAFSPDGRHLLAGGADNVIRVFEVASGRELKRLEIHADWVLGLAFAPDGKHFSSASRDKTARLFSTAGWELEETYDAHAQPVFAVAFARGGKRALSAARDHEIHAWTLTDAKKVFEIGGAGADVTRLACADDILFSVSANRVVRQHRVLDKQAELVRAYPAAADVIHALALDAASRRLATGSHDGTVRVFDVEKGALLREFVAAPAGR